MNLSVIYILWLRQIKRNFRRRSRIIGSLGQPILFLISMGFGLGPVYAEAGKGSYIQFLAPGIIAMSILFTSLFQGIEVIWDKQFGFLKETLVAPVSRFEIVFGRILGGATMGTIQGTIVLLLSFIIGFRINNYVVILPAILLMFLVGMAFASLGTAIASLLEDMQGFQLIMNFLVMPLFFLSGIFFPLKGLPNGLKLVVLFDPLSYAVDSLRYTLTNNFYFGIGSDLLVLIPFTVILLAAGSYLFSKIQI